MSGTRENNFGIIRLMGAVMVIIGHMYTLLGQGVPTLLWNSVNSIGVAIFFTIGGYLITLSWLREPKFKTYIIKRVFRIFPALIVCILLSVIVIGPLMTNLPINEYYSNPLTWAYMKNCLLYIHYALPGVFADNICVGTVNGSIWCLPVEFLMYLLIPIYISLGSKLPEKMQKWYYGIATVLVIVAGSVWTTWYYDTHFVFYGMDFSQIMQIVPYYFIGSLFAVCKLEKILNLQIAMVVTIFASGMCFLPAPFCFLAQYLVIPYVILSLALAAKPVFSVFNKIDISYGMFLFGFIIQQMLIQIFVHRGWTLNVWILMTLSILLSGIMGSLTEKIVEKPAGILCKRILEKIK